MESSATSHLARPITATLDDLVARAAHLAQRPGRTLLGIVGAPGAGKSTVCEALSTGLGEQAVVVGMDGFHLDNEVLIALGRRQRKGAPDTFDVPGYLSLLNRLRATAEDVTYAPRFDRALEMAIGSAVPVPRTTPLVITEGNYLLYDGGGWEDVREALDEVWYLDVSDQELRNRLVARRMSYGESHEAALDWVQGVDEANASVVAQGRHHADLIITISS
ncbi:MULTISPECIES: nucleoside/nucleotide kinase family protein [Tessaracoccus]|uniref:nucleoside/nucleotide kinase family protein n=1 Tax=Tessaracoccus TaxID=72763 RepID=UPI0018603C3A|nr:MULTISPECIES: nucleoside/nucleotide kinase family protein [Tessaracoccus]VEP39744.1 Uridine kinase [Tessaracoccus lapidicaptus]